MNLSVRWLRDFVDFSHSPAELRDLLTSRVATVDAVEPMRRDLLPIVVARVVRADRHPDAERLWLTKVDAGGPELLDVVCGAANVKEGALYPFASVGTTMPDGTRIERRKIRGQLSNGMLCSARELRLGEEGEGILTLEVDAAPGTPLLNAVPAGDARLVVDVLPNRPDLLSHVGIAREIAAALGVPLYPLGRLPGIASAESGEMDAGPARAEAVTIRVDSDSGTPRYLAALIEGIAVAPSPAWLRERIEAVGARSINNVVDATNFVLHAYGQPAHAFDADRLAPGGIHVRLARAGERLVTLDGVERTLDESMTVIADAERARAIAGVIGGRESEVTETTTRVLLEVAVFDPRRVRATRRALGLSTDASYRFERGVDMESSPKYLERLIALVRHLAGGSLAATGAHSMPVVDRPRVRVRGRHVSKLLGEHIALSDVRPLLEAIGFHTESGVRPELPAGEDDIAVRPPSWRNDIAREIDVIEEIARLRGYESFSSELRPFRPSAVPEDDIAMLSRRLGAALRGLGLHEVRPMPFVSGGDTTHVRVRNPLSENEAYLRRSLLESFARLAEHNLAHREGNVRLFEIGAVFANAAGSALPVEEMRVGVVVMGAKRPPHFTEPEPPAYDEWDAKGIAEALARMVHGKSEWKIEPSPVERSGRSASEEVYASAGKPLFEIFRDSDKGTATSRPIGRVCRLDLDAPVWAAAAFGVELTISAVYNGPARDAPATHFARERTPRYRPLPSQPPAEFDLALVVPDEIHAEDVERVMRAAAGDLLEQSTLFDEFRGEGVPHGSRSLAWRLRLRHSERTLKEKEIEARRARILQALQTELKVIPRG